MHHLSVVFANFCSAATFVHKRLFDETDQSYSQQQVSLILE